MNPIQKSLIQQLLRHAYSNGFDSKLPLAPMADDMGVSVEALYDEESESGELWEYGPNGNGALDITNNGHGTYAGVNIDFRDLLANWSGFSA